MKTFLIRCAGYSRFATKNASTADIEHLTRFGGLVLFASLWTAGSWAIASTMWVTGLSAAWSVAAAAIAAAVGFFLTLTIDAAALYVQDQQRAGRFLRLWLVFRVALILAVGVFTTERLMPYALHDDLTEQRLLDQEAADARRDTALNTRFATADLGRRSDSAEEAARRLETSLAVVPEDIRTQLDRAKACRRDVQEERARQQLGGATEDQLRLQFGVRFLRCADAERRAQAELAQHRRILQTQLADANESAKEARRQRDDAVGAVRDRVEAARAVEREAVSTSSAGVLWNLVTHNLFAAIKVLAIFVVSMTVETLPMVAKAFAGQTEIGRKLAAERAGGIEEAEAALQVRVHDAKVRAASATAVADMMLTALESNEVRESLRAFAGRQAMIAAPLMAALQTLREAQRNKGEFDTAAARTPEFAGLAFRLWAEAVAAAADPI